MIEYLLIYVTLVFVFLVYKYFSRNLNFWKDRGVSGPRPLPLVGNLLDNFATSITDLELQRSQKYGKVYGFFDLTQPMISVSDVNLIKLITMKDFSSFTNHISLAQGDSFYDKFMINLLDDEWRRVRNICIPSFTSNRIRQMFPLINQVVDNAMDHFNELSDSKTPIELQKTFSSFAVDVIARTLFGIEVNSFKDPDSEYTRNASNIFAASSLKFGIGLFLPSSLRKLFGFYIYDPKCCKYFKKLMKHVISESEGKKLEKINLLRLMQTSEMNDLKALSALKDEGLGDSYFDLKGAKKRLDEDEILAQCIQIILAGTETTANFMTYFMYTMATKPDIQSKLFAELNMYFKNKKYDLDSLLSLPYLDAVLNETMRRYTPAVQFNRVANNDYNLGDTGIIIPNGTGVNIPFHAIHHDPDYWEDPFEFKPERFLPENKDRIVPYSFAPFGYGPRICLGMKLALAELKAIIANTVYNFKIVKTERTPKIPKYTAIKFTNQCAPIYVLLNKRVN